MFARLWWKEARQTWPVWAFLACVGVALQGLVRLLAGPSPVEGYIPLAAVVTGIYLFLIAAAVFAGERESGTGHPVEAAAAYRPLFFSLISLTRL